MVCVNMVVYGLCGQLAENILVATSMCIPAGVKCSEGKILFW